ncbi:MAG: 2Fe-2S iron-sulfur cluster-binding protein [Syntrophobacteraceae bacterium]
MAKITVDGKQIDAEDGKSLLEACLKNGIYIPNLCFLETMDEPTGSCRLCFVEIEGRDKMTPSCQTKVADGMVVRTDGPEVREAQKVVFQLLFSAHHMACKNCLVKKNCQLQKIAKLLGVRLKASKGGQAGCGIATGTGTDMRHPCLELIPAKCILCRKCIHVCSERNKKPVLSLVKDGADMAIGFACDYPPTVNCEECRACVEVCPVSAIVPRQNGANASAAAENA